MNPDTIIIIDLSEQIAELNQAKDDRLLAKEINERGYIVCWSHQPLTIGGSVPAGFIYGFTATIAHPFCILQETDLADFQEHLRITDQDTYIPLAFKYLHFYRIKSD